MSKAEKMFNELGYVRNNIESKGMYYMKENDLTANEYWFINGALQVFCFKEKSMIIVKELRAIHEQMKELGWLDE